MNLFHRIFCRTVQFCFRIAHPFLPYRDPVALTDVLQIAQTLHKETITSVLLVTDHFLRNSFHCQSLIESLQGQGISCAVYDQTRPNPTVSNVEEALEMYRSNGCRALIAYGGGSAIDCAKAVGARIAYPKKNLNRLKGNLRVWRRLPLLIAVPTTAGTGSEVTVTAVITDPERKHKYTMNNFTFIPRYAVLDPKVTESLPKSLTATTGMDALTHAVEAYIGRSTTRETRALALEATKLVFENLEKAYADGGDLVARANMLRAAHAAGIAFSKSYVGYIHAVAHSLGGTYNVPHGLANAVALPIILEEYGAVVYNKLRELALAAGVADAQDAPQIAAEKFIAAIRRMNRNMGIPERISGIRREDIPAMAQYAAREANPLYPVPRLMNAGELQRLYALVADWKDTE